jgi:acyl-CoA reductase-like NAD-dependent aldehyde dehydrogenase
VCAAGAQLFVEKKIHDDFMQKLVDRAKKMQPSDPLDPKKRFGALVSQQQMNSMLEYIEEGRAEGAKLVAGGRACADGQRQGMLRSTDGV